ncbi:TIGR00730 family Rossman fold protein [Viridibacillus sp. YIM B01967]|uniref:Cytokinin riboside 5'-monophosphate phosphoribohydrolase n=1 Tax=Viridibacillus soli TaxID=2798301 RepID=A0ABS1HD37_9BACL|nr:TIGR00730 family Rossman fold protein [Viridibacillus soli]MBK3497312.1 TIGR00730 family Rossman fold protein [Viridibacillus soli]
MRVAIYCGSRMGENSIYAEKAVKLGGFLAKQGIGIVYGGSIVGLMGKVADEALENGGEVIGVMPTFMQWEEVTHSGLSDLLFVETMHERKAKMIELADAFIALPGGAGTMDEFFDVLTLSQVGQHTKPVCLYNINHYYNHLQAHLQHTVDEGFMHESQQGKIGVVSSPEELLRFINKLSR